MASKRKKRVEVRFKDSELECLQAAAARNDMTISEYIRHIVMKDCKK